MQLWPLQNNGVRVVDHVHLVFLLRDSLPRRHLIISSGHLSMAEIRLPLPLSSASSVILHQSPVPPHTPRFRNPKALLEAHLPPWRRFGARQAVDNKQPSSPSRHHALFQALAYREPFLDSLLLHCVHLSFHETK